MTNAWKDVSIDLLEITVDKIARAYTGKAGHCYCGCSGKYWEDVRNKKRVLKLVQTTQGKLEAYQFEGEGVIVTRETSTGKAYTLYLKKEEDNE